MWKALLAVTTLCLSSQCQSYKILAFLPFPSNSHHNVFFPLIHELARLGHKVTYYTPIEPSKTHPNLMVKLTMPSYKNDFLSKLDLEAFGKAPLYGITHGLFAAAEMFAAQYYGNQVAQQIINSNGRYDAVLMESFFQQEPVSALIHKFGCVGIELSSLPDSAWLNEWSGLPDNPAYQPDFKAELTDDMSLADRLYNIYSTGSTLLVSYYHMYKMQAITDLYFRYSGWEARPPLERLLPNRSMILVNTDPILNYPYPTAPHVKNVAGMNLGPSKPLPKELQQFMDEAKDGVIYFSFGSNLNTSDLLDGKNGEVFMNVFKTLPQKILLKWEVDSKKITLPSNIKTGKWLPQMDILAHKNCKVFITHGGFLSLNEAVYHGVPIIGVPFFGDQRMNALQAQKVGYGLVLKYDNITTASVSWALDQVISEPRYRAVARQRSQMLRDRRHSSLDEAVYWVEHAIKYPNSLTPRSAYMTFWERRIFDIGTFFFLTIAATYIGVSLLWCVIRKKRNPVVPKFKVS